MGDASEYDGPVRRDEDEALYPMRVVTRLTGLSPDVVRAWERRYGAIAPARTDGNARRYSHAALVRLGRLKDAVAAGHAISAVAQLSDEALASLIEKKGEAAEPTASDDLRSRYLEVVSRFDLATAEAMLARAAQLVTPREVALELVAPILREVGDRWHAGELSVAEEHAVTAQARALMATLLRTTSTPRGAPRVLFATPEGHHHEVGAMVAALIAAERGVQPIYIGADVPWAELAPAARAARASVVVLSMVLRPSAAAARRERKELSRLAAQVELWIGTSDGHPLARIEGARVFHDYAPFESALAHRFPT